MTDVAARPVSAAAPPWVGGARSVGRTVIALVLVFLAIELIVVAFGIRPYVMPRPSAVFAALARTPGAYWDGIVRTGIETVAGFLAGAVFGIGMGVAFSRLRFLREALFPVFVVSQTIPVIAFGAIVVLWFGNTMLSKIVIAFYLTFFPVTVNTLLGMRSVDPAQISLLRSFGAGDWQVMRRLQFPTALPHIFVALRLGSALGLVGAIVGEWFGDTTGLGVLLLQAMYSENMVSIWATILCSAALGLTLYGAVALLEKRIVFWEAAR